MHLFFQLSAHANANAYMFGQRHVSAHASANAYILCSCDSALYLASDVLVHQLRVNGLGPSVGFDSHLTHVESKASQMVQANF